MFCPKCKGLLKIPRSGRQADKYCPRCNDIREVAIEELPVEDMPTESAPNWPEKGHATMPFFPFPEVRKGQDKFIRDVAKSIATKKHLLAYAPTGIGKTVAVLAPAVEAAMEMGKVVCFLTSKQSQHHIAIETLKQMKLVSGREIRVVDLISKQAMCPADIAEEYPAAFRMLCHTSIVTKSCRYFTNEDASIVKFIHSNILHVEEMKTLATRRKTCPHKAAMQAAAEANVIVCDYNHIFDPVVRPNVEEAFGRPIGDFIIIVDEAHNLPDRIRGYYSMSLTTNMVEESLSEVRDKHQASILKGMKKDLAGLIEGVEDGKEALTTPAPLLEALEKRMSHSIVDRLDLETLIAQLRDIGVKRMADGRQSMAFEIAEFLDGYRKNLRGLVRIISRKDGMMLNYRLLDPSTVAAPMFASFHSSIVMSGTLFPTSVYADILGIPESSRMLGTYKSPFPEENRPVFVVDDVTTLYDQRNDAMFRKIANHISAACDEIPGNVAVFFQSYGMLKNITQFIKTTKEPIAESRESTKAEKRELVTTLIRAKTGKGGLMLAVMGGSMSEGIDYRDNLLDSVIVVGVPFAPPSLEQDQLIRYYDTKFGQGNGRDYGYTYPAMNRVLQSIGRCIRSETDRAAVILLDKRFKYPMYQKCFPADVKLNTATNLKTSLKLFYKK
jgi:DNA excision repair protein ERCC-2